MRDKKGPGKNKILKRDTRIAYGTLQTRTTTKRRANDTISLISGSKGRNKLDDGHSKEGSRTRSERLICGGIRTKPREPRHGSDNDRLPKAGALQ